MSASLVRWAFWVLVAVAGASFIAGCPSKEAQAKKAEAKWEGTYESATPTKETLQILAEHKAVIKNEQGPVNITWEPAGEDKFILHAPFPVDFFRTSEGLRDGTGVVWKKKG